MSSPPQPPLVVSESGVARDDLGGDLAGMLGDAVSTSVSPFGTRSGREAPPSESGMRPVGLVRARPS